MATFNLDDLWAPLPDIAREPPNELQALAVVPTTPAAIVSGASVTAQLAQQRDEVWFGVLALRPLAERAKPKEKELWMLVDQLGPSAWGTILTALVRYRQLEASILRAIERLAACLRADNDTVPGAYQALKICVESLQQWKQSSSLVREHISALQEAATGLLAAPGPADLEAMFKARNELAEMYRSHCNAIQQQLKEEFAESQSLRDAMTSLATCSVAQQAWRAAMFNLEFEHRKFMIACRQQQCLLAYKSDALSKEHAINRINLAAQQRRAEEHFSLQVSSSMMTLEEKLRALVGEVGGLNVAASAMPADTKSSYSDKSDGDFSIGFKGLSIGAKRSETSSGSSETAYGSRVASITAAYANVQQLAQSLPAAITQQVGAATSAFQATIESYKAIFGELEKGLSNSQQLIAAKEKQLQRTITRCEELAQARRLDIEQRLLEAQTAEAAAKEIIRAEQQRLQQLSPMAFERREFEFQELLRIKKDFGDKSAAIDCYYANFGVSQAPSDISRAAQFLERCQVLARVCFSDARYLQELVEEGCNQCDQHTRMFAELRAALNAASLRVPLSSLGISNPAAASLSLLDWRNSPGSVESLTPAQSAMLRAEVEQRERRYQQVRSSVADLSQHLALQE